LRCQLGARTAKEQGRPFFFLKKKEAKKTFVSAARLALIPARLRRRLGARATAAIVKSLFASFSSEKEESLPSLN
jgi:hypothetical protein